MNPNPAKRNERPIRVGVLSQSELVYFGLRESIQHYPDLRCSSKSGAAWSPRAVLPDADVVVAMLNPHVLLDVVQAGNIRNPRVPVVGVIEAMPVSEEEIVQLVRAGIAGLTTLMSAKTLVSIVRLAVQQVPVTDMAVMMQAMADTRSGVPQDAAEGAAVTALSAADRSVLAWVAHGYSNRQIAEKLGMTVSVVKHRVGRILKQLRVSSRIMLVPLYVEYQDQLREQPFLTGPLSPRSFVSQASAAPYAEKPS